ncbi:MAG: 3-dehydroquinate synthase [Paludibacter sp.]|jgi:3-dehydroquinate synthase|nr:3-dehydroquinate synthase [Paludibacter sp.]
MSNIKLSAEFCENLANYTKNYTPENIFVLVDNNTQNYCLPLLREVFPALSDSRCICIASGDENKNLAAVAQIWEFLSRNRATRHSLLVNLGGGMITDIGGFAAATFKRGMAYINIPTTLLGAVDAATGGKTGINFDGLKNEIGVFRQPLASIVDTAFFATLDEQNIYSAYAEMLKHALISTVEDWKDILSFDFETIDYRQLKVLVDRSIAIKQQIVEQDPDEKSLRKALNFGHTAGHAFESLSHRQQRPVLHGYAVAWGLVCELYLSHVKLSFPKSEFLRLKNTVKAIFGTFAFTCSDYAQLYEFMQHDKKNESENINFTLLANIGDVRINQTATRDEIFEMLDFFSANS